MLKEKCIKSFWDIQDVPEEMFPGTLQAMLEAEMSDWLGH